MSCWPMMETPKYINIYKLRYHSVTTGYRVIFYLFIFYFFANEFEFVEVVCSLLNLILVRKECLDGCGITSVTSPRVLFCLLWPLLSNWLCWFEWHKTYLYIYLSFKFCVYLIYLAGWCVLVHICKWQQHIYDLTGAISVVYCLLWCLSS